MKYFDEFNSMSFLIKDDLLKNKIKSGIESTVVLKNDFIANQSTMKSNYKLKGFVKTKPRQIFMIMEYLKRILIMSFYQ